MSLSEPRPSWDEYFIHIARTVATRSTCPRLSVGAITVRDQRILTTGYNGSPPKTLHCTDNVSTYGGCIMVNNHCIRTIHAEQNAIIQGALHGVSVKNSTLYVTHLPCNICAKMLIGAGIARIVFSGDYYDEHTIQFLKNSNIEITQLK